MSKSAIGIFDSGVGGLTVASAIHQLLPGEDLIYLGDTARLPYGSKSRETIIRYADHAAEFLLQHNIKALVIACNTATAAALEYLQQKTAIPVLGVIEPGAVAAVATGAGRIGVIGTCATISSKAYGLAIKKIAPDVEVTSVACPLFVPLAEENFIDHPATELIARTYLQPLIEARVETLVLGCTHYPLLRPVLQRVMGPGVRLVDSAATAADFLKQLLQQAGTLGSAAAGGQLTFYVTDANERFSQIAGHFFASDFSRLTQTDL